MPLQPLPKLPSIQGNISEEDKVLKDVEEPEEDRDAVNKKYLEDNYTPL